MSKMLWVARDMDGSVWTYDTQPFWVGPDHWQSSEFGAEWDSLAFPDLESGECRMFVEFAPRVAGGEERNVLAWNDDEMAWGYHPCPFSGDIIHPMLPDQTPYLAHPEVNEARIAELLAERDRIDAEIKQLEGE